MSRPRSPRAPAGRAESSRPRAESSRPREERSGSRAAAADPAIASRAGLAGLVSFAVLAVAHLVAGLAPDSRAWGVHALAFLPRVAWGAGLVFLVALVAPGVARRLGDALLDAADWVLGTWARTAAVALAAGVLFYVLRLKFQFLGDGVVWLEKIEHGQPFPHFEPLATTVVAGVARLSKPVESGAGWPAIVAGVAYALATASLCRTLWSEPAPRALAWSLLLVNPALLLFFGYVESYPVLLVLQVLFVLALVGGRRSSPFIAGGILALAIAWHLQAVAWLPALVVLPWLGEVAGEPSPSPRRSDAMARLGIGALGGMLAVGMALVLVRAAGASPRRLLVGLGDESALGGVTGTWLFSARHGLDLANEAALVLGPALLVVVPALAAGRAARVPIAGRWALVALSLAGPLLFALVVEPRIGGARDWDLYLGMMLPATLLAVEAWNRLDAAVRAPRTATTSDLGRALAGRALGVALVATGAYLAVQLDAPRAARRLTVLQDGRGTFANFARGYANETLGIYYRDRDAPTARDAYARAVQANPANARYYHNLGTSELRLHHLEAARDAFKRASELGLKEWFVLHNIGVADLQLHNPAAAESAFAEAVQRWPDRWLEHSGLAQARLEQGRAADALPEIERARALAPHNADVLYLYGWALGDLGRTDEARAALSEAVRIDPQHAAAKRALDALSSSP